MGSILETIKKGISALNPVGTPVDKTPQPIKENPVGQTVLKKVTGYLGNTSRKATARNKETEDVANQVQ